MYIEAVLQNVHNNKPTFMFKCQISTVCTSMESGKNCNNLFSPRNLLLLCDNSEKKRD